MIVDIGNMGLLIALLVACYVVVVSFVGALQKIPVLVSSGRLGISTIPILLLISTLALVYSFVTNDFSVRYVAENSNLSMPVNYTWVAFYAGNSGSLLFITLVLSILCVIVVLSSFKKLPHSIPFTTGLLGIVLTFFLAVIVFLANPLDRIDGLIPVDGQGINPLLIHFGMFIHPPMQMAGLISVVVPFSIAMGALLAGRGGRDEWVDLGRVWGMISWLILTIGLILGSWWAYTILGWGGYWAWDPVENSALMPWLVMTAFVHSIMVQKRRGMFRMWNIVLITIAFSFAEMGMFINRGGPVPSVHSFASSTLGWIFLFFMGFTLLASLFAFAWRINTLKSDVKLDSIFSRESVFLIQNVLFLVVALVTLWGTIYPLIAEVSDGVTLTVGEPFFNIVNGPILLVIVFLMGVGPLLPWRSATARNILGVLKYPLIGALIIAIVLIVSGVSRPVALLALSVCTVSLIGIIHEWIRGTLSRHRKGESYPLAFYKLIIANRPRYGGYVVHIAITMLAIGAIGSSFYEIQRDFTLQPGDTASLGGYVFKYDSFEQIKFSDRDELTASFSVHDGSNNLGIMNAKRAYYPAFNLAATRAGIRSTVLEDFYIVPSEFSNDGGAVFRVHINPLVWWMWASGPLLFLGTLLAISPHIRRRVSVLKS